MTQVWTRWQGAHLIVAGATTAYTQTLKELAAKVDTARAKRIHFEDNIDEKSKANIIQACQLFVTPSGYESFGVTILEAWAWHKPVIACRLEATRHLIDEYQTGLLVNYRDPRELSAAIIELLDDKELQRRMGHNGYQKLMADFTIETVGPKYRQFCQEVLNR